MPVIDQHAQDRFAIWKCQPILMVCLDSACAVRPDKPHGLLYFERRIDLASIGIKNSGRLCRRVPAGNYQGLVAAQHVRFLAARVLDPDGEHLARRTE
jgi:hypothetical protein